MDNMTTYQIKLRGIADMLHHNGEMANPLSATSRAMKDVSKKRMKTDADFEHLANLEFQGGIYIDTSGKITVPARLLDSCIHEGAKNSKEGKQCLTGLFVNEETINFTFDGPTTVDARMNDPACRLVVGVRVGQARIMRCRPLFKNWKLEFTVTLADPVAGRDHLSRWLHAAGQLKGIGDWRPRYGRFSDDGCDAI